MNLAAEMQWEHAAAADVLSPQLAIAGALEPAYDVAGDTFDYAINGDVLLVFAILDAMGHGYSTRR